MRSGSILVVAIINLIGALLNAFGVIFNIVWLVYAGAVVIGVAFIMIIICLIKCFL